MKSAFVAVLMALGTSTMPRADVSLDKEGKLLLQGGFTFRLESDWDSHDAAGVGRNDRNRARVRARLGLRYDLSANVSFGVRVRTGVEPSQQSQFITVLDSDSGAVSENDFIWDKYYVTAKKGGAWATAGRENFPFWTQNELFWDNDVTPAGVSSGYRFKTGRHHLDVTGAYVALPDGSTRLAGDLAAGQIVYGLDDGWWSMTTALGIFHFNGSPGAVNLLHGNGARDYGIWVGGAQLKLPTGYRPITFGVDFMHNGERYSENDPDPFTRAHRGHRDGYVLSAIYGWLKMPGDWQVSYYHARIEALAVNSSYAQDDWARWGTATQGDSSDLKGSEFRGTVKLGRNLSMMARYYFVQAITSPQDGKRFRVDFIVEL